MKIMSIALKLNGVGPNGFCHFNFLKFTFFRLKCGHLLYMIKLGQLTYSFTWGQTPLIKDYTQRGILTQPEARDYALPIITRRAVTFRQRVLLFSVSCIVSVAMFF